MDNDGLGDDCDTDNDNDGVADLFDNCLYIANPDQKDVDGDRLGDVCDNCPNVTNPDQIDSDSDGIGDVCEAGPIKTICSILGNDPKPSRLDQDVFKFTGSKDEQVRITISADPPQDGNNKRLTLLLVDNIPKVTFTRADRSILPNEISAKLPARGEYFITVAEQAEIFLGQRYRGKYCLTLETSLAASQTLAPTPLVE